MYFKQCWKFYYLSMYLPIKGDLILLNAKLKNKKFSFKKNKIAFLHRLLDLDMCNAFAIDLENTCSIGYSLYISKCIENTFRSIYGIAKNIWLRLDLCE